MQVRSKNQTEFKKVGKDWYLKIVFPPGASFVDWSYPQNERVDNIKSIRLKEYCISIQPNGANQLPAGLDVVVILLFLSLICYTNKANRTRMLYQWYSIVHGKHHSEMLDSAIRTTPSDYSQARLQTTLSDPFRTTFIFYCVLILLLLQYLQLITPEVYLERFLAYQWLRSLGLLS